MAELGVSSSGAEVTGGTGTQGGNTGGTAGAATGTPTGLTTQGTGAAGVTTPIASNPFHASGGWYITGAIVVSVALANTAIGPILLGVLGLSLIYQTSLLLQHK